MIFHRKWETRFLSWQKEKRKLNSIGKSRKGKGEEGTAERTAEKAKQKPSAAAEGAESCMMLRIKKLFRRL